MKSYHGWLIIGILLLIFSEVQIGLMKTFTHIAALSALTGAVICALSNERKK